MRAERLARFGAELGEGPVWRSESNEIIWVDILRGEILATNLDGSTRLIRRHAMPVGAVGLTESGDILASTPIGLVDEFGTVIAALPVTASDVRANDGKADPAGRFLSGTITVDEARADAGALWCLDADGPRMLVEEATIANGLAWSEDGSTLYWIDSATAQVDAFDYDLDTGTVSSRRAHIVPDSTWGSPDGMCIDRDGRLWVAFWGGGAVRCFEDSTCVELVEVPTPLVTCPTFVGPEFDILAITTASLALPSDLQGAGDLYAVKPGCRGAAPFRIGGWAL